MHYKVLTSSPLTTKSWIKSLEATATHLFSASFKHTQELDILTKLCETISKNRFNIDASFEGHITLQKELSEILKKTPSQTLKEIAEFLSKLSVLNSALEQASHYVSNHHEKVRPTLHHPTDLGMIFTAHPTIWLREFSIRVIGNIRKVAKAINNADHHHVSSQNADTLQKMIIDINQQILDFKLSPPLSPVKPSFAKIIMVIAGTPLKNVMSVTAETCVRGAKASAGTSATSDQLADEIRRFSEKAAPGAWAGYDCDGCPNVSINTFETSANLWSLRNLGYQRDNLQKIVDALTASGNGGSPEAILAKETIQRLGNHIKTLVQETKDALKKDIGDQGSMTEKQCKKAIEELELTAIDIFEKTQQPTASEEKYQNSTEFRAEIQKLFSLIHATNSTESDIAFNTQKALAMATANGFYGVHIQRREEVNLLENAVIDIATRLGNMPEMKNISALTEQERQTLFTKLYEKVQEMPMATLNKLGLATDTIRQIEQLRYLKTQYETDPNSVRFHVLSMCRTPSNFLAAMTLFKIAGLDSTAITPIPLFEMPDDLKNATQTIQTLTQNTSVQTFLASRGNKLKIMLAHSDSTRTSGMSSKLRHFLIRTEVDQLQRDNAFNGISIEFFDGGGGSIPRGGDKMMHLTAMNSLPTRLNESRYFTIQGEELTAGPTSKRQTEVLFQQMTDSTNPTLEKPNFEFSKQSLDLLNLVTDQAIQQYQDLFFYEKDLVDCKKQVMGIELTKLANLSPRPTTRPTAQAAAPFSPISSEDVSPEIQHILQKFQDTVSSRPSSEASDITGDPIQDSRTISVVAATYLSSSPLCFIIGLGTTLTDHLDAIKESMKHPDSVFNHPYILQYIFAPILMLFAHTSWPALAKNCSEVPGKGKEFFELIQSEAKKTFNALETLIADRPEFSQFFKDYKAFGESKSKFDSAFTQQEIISMIFATLKSQTLSAPKDTTLQDALASVMVSAPALNTHASEFGGLRQGPRDIGRWG